MKVLRYTVFNDQEDMTLELPIAVSKNVRIAREFIPSKLSSASFGLLSQFQRNLTDNATTLERRRADHLNLPSLFGPANP